MGVCQKHILIRRPLNFFNLLRVSGLKKIYLLLYDNIYFLMLNPVTTSDIQTLVDLKDSELEVLIMSKKNNSLIVKFKMLLKI